VSISSSIRRITTSLVRAFSSRESVDPGAPTPDDNDPESTAGESSLKYDDQGHAILPPSA